MIFIASLAIILATISAEAEVGPALATKRECAALSPAFTDDVVAQQRLLRIPSMRIEEDVMTKEECEALMHVIPDDNAFNKTCGGYRFYTYFTPGERLLGKVCATRTDKSCDAMQIPISRVHETTKPHRDWFDDEDKVDTYGKIVDEEVALLFINDNYDAFFHYGEHRIPLKCGTKLTFHGGYPHHTEVNSGIVQFLGPVTSSSCSSVSRVAVGGGAGDPHIKKWNGESYDYHGECDLVLVSSPHFGSGTGLSVHIRTKIVDNWSFISSAAVKIGDDVLEATNRGRFWVNGKKVPIPTSLSGYTVSYKAATDLKHDKWHVFTIDLGDGQHVVIKSFNLQNMLAVTVRGASLDDFKDSGGLMGSFKSGVLLRRDGSTVIVDEDANEFGQEWQVQDDDPKLFRWQRAPQWPAHCIVPLTKPSKETMSRDRRRLIQEVSYDEAVAACAQWREADKEYCIADVLATNDLELAKSGSYWE